MGAEKESSVSTADLHQREMMGFMKASFQAQTMRLSELRQDISNMRQEHSQGMQQLEERLGKSIEKVSQRVDSQDEELKALAVQTAKMSAMGGGAGGLLVAAAVELIKRFAH